MPSLLSRFLGKKKNADQSPLLDGEKFEAVPRTTSPSTPTFGVSAHRTKSKEKEQDKGQGKRAKRSQAGVYDSHRAESVPVLSLSLPDAKDEEKKSQGLGVVFEGITDGPKTLDDVALGEKRLSPSETLILVQKTSEVLNERGLETLGVMRPHWFASPRQQEIQLKLIHRFIATLDSPKTTAESSSPNPRSAFESELRYSRDPHDVAAVLRWGLRHLQLEGTSFGTSAGGDWYRTFADSERSGSYPTKAFDDILVPLLPASHTNLLRATLDMVSSLAAHSEENGISGNKLSKVLGWWIVSSRNTQGGRWPEFYAQWEAAARQFEHLFLAYIRAQDAQSRMPKRLTELVKNYPFAKNRREEDGVYLPKSRFSTRSADALFVQVTVDKSTISSRPHPLRIVEDAFRAIAESETTGVYATFWEEIRKVASQPGSKSREEDADEAAPPLNLTTILADESIRLFSLVPTPDGTAAPTLSLFTPLPTGRGRRSLSVGERSPTSPTANGRAQSATRDSSAHAKSATSPPSSSQGHEVAPDWQVFSSAGFESPSGLSLAASLWDNDTEVSHPVSKKATTSKRPSRAGSSRRRSADLPVSARPVVESAKPARRTYSAPRMVTLDEAFIDFWADSLLDSIARTWPTFVLCQLKPLPALKRTEDGKPIEWLVIECVSDEPKRSTPPPIKTSSASARAASPLPSPTKSDASKSKWTSSTMSATRKRFSFFASRNETAPAAQGGRDRVAKKAAKDGKVGEMGEILREEDESVPNGVKANGTQKAETPKKSTEKAQPVVNHVNGTSKIEEPEVAALAKDVPRQEAVAVPVEPASEEPAPKPSLSPIEETDVPKKPAEPAATEIVKSAPSSAVVEEVSKPQPVVEETKAPAPVEVPTATHAPVEVPIATPAPVEAPTATPAPVKVPAMPPVPTAPAPVVPEEKEPTPEVVDIPAAPELAQTTAPEEPVPQVDARTNEPVEVPAEAPVETPAEAPVNVTPKAPAEAPVEPYHEAQLPTEVAPPAVPEPEVHVPANTEPPKEAAPEVVPPPAELPVAEPPAPGPYVHHATIFIPPADENDLAQLRQPPISEDDELESSVQDESVEPVHSPHPTEPEPAPQASAEAGQEPAATTQDAAKVDAAIQEVPEEEKGADEHPPEVTP